MFQKLANLLSERASDKKILREAEQAKRLQKIWEEKGITLFPENLHEHIRKNTRVLQVRRDEIILGVGDAHTKNALALKQTELQRLLEVETGISYQAIRLKSQQV